MTTAARPLPQTGQGSARLTRGALAAGIFLIVLILLAALNLDVERFPESWDIGLSAPIDSFGSQVLSRRMSHPFFAYFIDPLSDAIDVSLRFLENRLLALPWIGVLLTAALLAYRASGIGLAAFAAAALYFMAAVGLWSQSMQTLALMAVAVLISLAVGIPLGLWAGRSDRVDGLLRPLLDTMQTLPSFVYLIPIVLFFGVARVPSVVATVIFALPPVVRLTSLGIRQAPHESVEAADAFGSTFWQKLVKVQIPLALPTILAGVNQTIMMALGMVVIAALVGAGGLGREVLLALQRLRVGQALEAGLAIVFVAILLDRISGSFSRHSKPTASPARGPMRRRNLVAGAALAALALVFAADAYLIDLDATLPAAQFSIRGPVDGAVRWMRDHLYQFGDLPIGAGPFSDFLVIRLLNPLRSLLLDWLPWPAVILALALVAYLSSGTRLGVVVAIALFATGLLGLWPQTMDTLSQVLVAVVVTALLGLPLGIWSARSDRAATAMRPILDFLQTIPVFVYLVPVIMLFNVGRVPGIIASVLYAIPPLIRLTDLGIRRVPHETVEAADLFGSTPWQRLAKVQIPLAMPTIMLGVNQAVILVLSMVCIAGLVGGGALGFEAINGLAKNELGSGMEAGLAIVLLAIVLDRITQSWSKAR